MLSARKLELPEHFVFLGEVDGRIIGNLRYGTKENFTGRVVCGYEGRGVICTRQMAEALRGVEDEVLKDGYNLLVYDAYRPQMAVDSWLIWSKDLDDVVAKERYYPGLSKEEMFEKGLIRSRSAHSRGSSVDLTLIEVGRELKAVEVQRRELLNGEVIMFLDDGSVDMGTSFDLFHEASAHDSALIGKEHKQMRGYLRDKMRQHGFEDFWGEWWHYTLNGEVYPETYFNFPIYE